MITAKESTLIRALEDLDERLFIKYKGNISPIELNVVGGFALMMNKIRLNPNEFTDIDYIGDELTKEVRELIDEVGIEYNLGKKWINNDVLLAGSSLEEIQFAVGALHFKKMLELKVFIINVLEPRDLLRMKVVAIDTSLMAAGLRGEFTRTKDFKDVKSIMEFLGFSTADLIRESSDYVMENETFKLIKEYIKTGKNRFT